MKKTVLALVVAAATGVALSAQAPAQTPSASKKQAPAASASKQTPAKTTGSKVAASKKAHVETAEVVSTDASAKSITVKPATGDNETYTATGGAVAQLARVKAGDHVRLTVHDNDVTRITMAPAKHSARKGAAKKG